MGGGVAHRPEGDDGLQGRDQPLGDRVGTVLEVGARPGRCGVRHHGAAALAAGLGAVAGDPGEDGGRVVVLPRRLLEGRRAVMGEHQGPARGVAHVGEARQILAAAGQEREALGRGAGEQHAREGGPVGEGRAVGLLQPPSVARPRQAADGAAAGQVDAGEEVAGRGRHAGGSDGPVGPAPGGGDTPGRPVLDAGRETRVAGGEELGAVVEAQAVRPAPRRHAAAGTAALVEHDDPVPGIVQATRRRGPGDARPDDRDGPVPAQFRRSCLPTAP